MTYRLERVGRISSKERQRVTVAVDSGHNWRENGMSSQSEYGPPLCLFVDLCTLGQRLIRGSPSTKRVSPPMTMCSLNRIP